MIFYFWENYGNRSMDRRRKKISIIGMPKEIIKCAHCSLSCREIFEHAGMSFCCVGCRTAWTMLSDSGLIDFYRIRDKFDIDGISVPPEFDRSFVHFDDALFQEEHVRKFDSGLSKITFYVPEVYCAACVWLLERLPKCATGILESKLNLSRKHLEISFLSDKISLSQIGTLISSLGYTPLTLKDEDSEGQNVVFNQDIARLAVAVFSAMNCMMIAVSLYQGWWSGIDRSMKTFLEIVSAFVAFPAVAYSAKPIILRSLGGLKMGKVTLDLPLSIGILVGFIF